MEGATTTDKVREDRYRRRLYRQGYLLMKSRARDPQALTYGGYQIVHIQTRLLVGGWGNAERRYALDLDGVQAWLEDKD